MQISRPFSRAEHPGGGINWLTLQRWQLSLYVVGLKCPQSVESFEAEFEESSQRAHWT